MKCACVYARVSTAEQTTENQVPVLTALARARGYEVVEVVEEVMSGAKKARPGLLQLQDGAHKRRFDAVFVWAIDRLGRSMQGVVQVVLELDRLGVEVVSHQEGWLQTSGPVRPLLLSIFAWVAEQERARLIERTREGLARARAQGKRPGRPVVRVDLEEAFRLRRQGKSYRAIARELGCSEGTARAAMKAEHAPAGGA